MKAYHTRVVGNPMEPRAAMGSYDPAKDMYFLHGTTQGVGPMRGQLSAVLGVAPDKVRVVAEEVGGGFGVRFNAYPEYGALLYAAKKLGRPVKWIGTRSEVFLGDEQARDIVHTGEMALDADGRILGMRFDYLSNLGAYVAFTGAVVNTIGLVNVNCGVYDVQAVHVRGRLALTNTIPTAAYRGAGRPVASYALERLVDEAAQRTRPGSGGIPPPQHDPEGEDALQAGRRLRIRQRGFRRRHGQGACRIGLEWFRRQEESLQGERQAARPRHRHLHRDDRARRLRALRPGAHHLGRRTARVTLRTASHNHGQSHETTFAQIVSGVLGIPMEKIRLRTAEAGLRPDRESRPAARARCTAWAARCSSPRRRS